MDRAANFRGYDECLIVSLLSRGILDFPYANRPLNLIWDLPAWAVFPGRLVGFLVFHVAWIGLSGQPMPCRRVHGPSLSDP